MAAKEKDWAFRKDGLGSLRFGMTPEEIRQFDDIYGAVRSEHSWAHSEEEIAIWEKAIANWPNRDELAERERQTEAFLAKTYTEYLSSTLQLSYYEGHLFEITTDDGCRYFNIDGAAVHRKKTHIDTILRALAKHLGENPFREGPDTVFPKSKVSLYDDRDGRSVTWSSRAENIQRDNFDEYTELKLLED
ncbi:hypothetical protein [Breznakiella homolactica]|uniref:Uncharacterized protein n=1 Tax=Breznakiella homolactica TaxID=2798577 RepID=A0A7T7XJX2_9SPIR|nr:hypothetical protein [Breznakiella homolactica]QQO07587.1 hypothetical protein JFL75_11580 [Breznakiella homolactica]